jgi:hypothetical protein
MSATATKNGHGTQITLPQPIQPPVSTLTTAQAMAWSRACGGMAVAEIEQLYMRAIAERAQALVDAACAEVDKAREAAQHIGDPGYKGDDALRTIEYCVTRAQGYEREAKRRQKEYLKLVAKYGNRD